MFKNHPDGTMLCIDPLMVGIENDIKQCISTVEVGMRNGISAEELYKIYNYLSRLNRMRSDLTALDNSSVEALDVIKKFKEENKNG